MKTIQFIGILVLVAGVAAFAAALTPTEFEVAKSARPIDPAADLISFCHLDRGLIEGITVPVVIRVSSGAYNAHDRHGDCLVSDGSEIGQRCLQVDRDSDLLCDANGDPEVGG